MKCFYNDILFARDTVYFKSCSVPLGAIMCVTDYSVIPNKDNNGHTGNFTIHLSNGILIEVEILRNSIATEDLSKEAFELSKATVQHECYKSRMDFIETWREHKRLYLHHVLT
jgi:hypothetical protein